MTIREHVLEYIQRKDYTPKTKEELATAFDIEVSEFREFFRVIKDMEKERLISFTKKEKIIFGQGDFLIRGTLQGHRSGDFCYLLPEDKELGDVYISKENLNGAIHKDQVEVEVIQEKKDSRNAEGKVVNILTEKRDPIVGTFQAVKAYGFIVPDDNKYGFDLFIRAGDKNGAKNEDKAIARIDNTNPKEKNPTGVVLEVLGNKDIAGIDITSVVKDLGIPDVFSKKVLDQAAKVPQEVEEKEKHQRVDYRDLFTVTIDGEDAKDFDDAISIDKKEDGYVLYVHIADVAH
ncbi:MAG: RNB domain-containing ribonuclease, partial [Gallicola sp.]|nr:RNB domain-containing ribonuclease [Gallicola sp.]